MTTDSEFHDEMVSLYQRTGQAFGYWPSRFLGSVRKTVGSPWPRSSWYRSESAPGSTD